MRIISCLTALTFLIIALQSCRQDVKIRLNQVENITFYAMPKGIERSHSLVSFQDLKREGRDTLITDSVFICDFVGMINGLSPDNSMKSIDIRSVAVIALDTRDSLFIAFGENGGTVILNDNGKDKWEYHKNLDLYLPSSSVNGVFMKDNPSLFQFIDEYVYGTHSNVYWFNDKTRSLVESMTEAYQDMLHKSE